MFWLLLGGIPLGILALLGLIMIAIDEPVFIAGVVLAVAAILSVAHGIDQLGIK